MTRCCGVLDNKHCLAGDKYGPTYNDDNFKLHMRDPNILLWNHKHKE